MRSRLLLSTVLLCSLGLFAAACGNEDDGGAIVAGDSDGDGGGNSSSGGGAAGGPAVDVPITNVPLPVDPNTPVSNDPGDDPAMDPANGEARIVSPTPGLTGVVESALDSALLRDGNKVEARFYGGVADCYGVDHVDVEETAAAVTITVFTGIPQEAIARSCIEIAELQAVIVPLGAPLGDRVVIDGSSGAQVPLS